MTQGVITQSELGRRCPFCGVTGHMVSQGRAQHQRTDQVPNAEGGLISHGRQWTVWLYECPACGEVNVELSRSESGAHNQTRKQTVYPVSPLRPVPKDVPSEFADDFSEAAAIVTLSPQASAAVSRRVVQALLRGPGGVGPLKSLSAEIDKATGIPSHIHDNLHLLREVGNFAAHPMKDTQTGEICPVEPDEAEFMLDLVEQLFDHYFVAPAKAAAIRSKVNAKLQQAGKRPV